MTKKKVVAAVAVEESAKKEKDDQVLVLKKQVAALVQRSIEVETKISELNDAIVPLTPLMADRTAKSFRERVKALSAIVQLLITKVTVATEISWLANRAFDSKATEEQRRARQNLVNAAVIRALDYPDAWWKKHGNRPMGLLLNELLAAFERDINTEYDASPKKDEEQDGDE